MSASVAMAMTGAPTRFVRRSSHGPIASSAAVGRRIAEMLHGARSVRMSIVVWPLHERSTIVRISRNAMLLTTAMAAI